MKLNKYDVVMVGLLIVFIILLFSGLSDSSLYGGIFSCWVIVFTGLSGAKAHSIRNPNKISKIKIASFILFLAGILSSIFLIITYNFHLPLSSLGYKTIITIFNCSIIIFLIFNMFFKRKELRKVSVLIYFIEIIVLLLSIVIFWLLPF
jgi:hypothetical protein